MAPLSTSNIQPTRMVSVPRAIISQLHHQYRQKSRKALTKSTREFARTPRRLLCVPSPIQNMPKHFKHALKPTTLANTIHRKFGKHRTISLMERKFVYFSINYLHKTVINFKIKKKKDWIPKKISFFVWRKRWRWIIIKDNTFFVYWFLLLFSKIPQ